jgi:O-acetyl-ADP-ribose deacetylase (regulator of RNase III)
MGLNKVTIDFVDHSISLINEYSKAFGRDENIKFNVGDILKNKYGSLVSPANCYGNMDGGIDLEYNHFIKTIDLEGTIQTYINDFHHGKLSIGTAQIIPTYDNQFPYIIFSPTVEKPGKISSGENIKLAMYALIKEVYLYNRKFDEDNDFIIDHLLIPGLGTGYGNVNEKDSATNAKKGYDKAIEEIFNGDS